MKSVKLRSILLVLASGICLVSSQFSGLASAATPAAPNANSNTLKVSPIRTDVTLEPGTSTKVQTFVTNITKSPILIKPIMNDFVAGDEKGNPALIADENSYAPTHSLKRFMVPLSNVTIQPGATQQIDVTITVPKSAQAGGYYGAVRFAPASADGSNNVNLAASVASLILLRVPGDTVEQLTLTNFDIQQNGGTASNFRTPDNLVLLMRFQNKGNIQEAPFGQIYVKKGSKVVYKYDFNQEDPKQNILPDSARRWDIPLKNLGKFGKYTVGATLAYGQKGQSIEVQKTVWIVPSVYIAIGLGSLILLIAIGVGLYIFLRSYKRRILRSSRRRY